MNEGLLCSSNTRDAGDQWKVSPFAAADSNIDIKHDDDEFAQDIRLKLRKERLELLQRVERLQDLKVAGSMDILSGDHQYAVSYNSNLCNHSRFRKNIISEGEARVNSHVGDPRLSNNGLIEFSSFRGEPISYTKSNIGCSDRPSWVEYVLENNHLIRQQLSSERVKRCKRVNYADNGGYNDCVADQQRPLTDEITQQIITNQIFSNANSYNGAADPLKQEHYLVGRRAMLEDIKQLPKSLISVSDHHDQQELRTRKRNNITDCDKGSSIFDEDHQLGLQLVHLLLTCASAISENNKYAAAEMLSQIYVQVSETGDSIQRVGAHLAEALAARLFTKSSPFYRRIMKKPSPEEQFAAFVAFYRVSPYYQFAHFTANQAILEAFEGHDSVHVIDFDVSYGFQWPSLIQSLAEREKPPSQLRITGFGSNEQLLKETGIRLSDFVASCRPHNNNNNMSFQFHAFIEGSKEISAENLAVKRANHDETVAVNLVLHLHGVGSSENIHSRLKAIQSLKPSIITLVENEANHNAPKFLCRFVESLYYYAALFDSLDECLPLQSSERLRVERVHLGKQMKNIIVCEENERRQRHERLEVWKGRMEKAGFMQIALSSRSVSQAKMLLRIRRPSDSRGGGVLRGEGFSIYERDQGRVLSLSWQDRQLITASVWKCKLKEPFATVNSSS